MTASTSTPVVRRGALSARLLLVLATATILLVALAGWALWTSASARPAGPQTDFAAQMQQNVADAQPSGRDAWPDILAAVAIYSATATETAAGFPSTPDRESIPDFTALIDDSWRDEIDPEFEADEIAHAEANIAHARALLDAIARTDLNDYLDAVAASPRAVRPIDSRGEPLINILLPELRDSRNIARLLHARAQLAAEAGDWQAAAADLERILALARVHRAQATLIDHLVGIAIQALAHARLDAWIADLDPPAAALEAFAGAIDRQHSPLGIAHALTAGERIWALDMIQWTHTPAGRAIPTEMRKYNDPAASDALPPALANLAGFTLPSADTTRAALEDIYGTMIETARTPAADRTVTDEDFQRMVERNWLAKILVPAINRALYSGDEIAARRNLSRTALALELHRARTGSLPASLADLPAPPPGWNYLNDPATADQPLTYRIDPAQPTGYLLYARGPDGDDDQGAPISRDDRSTGDILFPSTP